MPEKERVRPRGSKSKGRAAGMRAGSKKFKGLGNCILESRDTTDYMRIIYIRKKRNFFESLIEDWSSFDSHTHSRVSF